MTYSKEFLHGLYTMMLRIRCCEESLVTPILKGEIKTPCHLTSGEEAIATGLCAALQAKDHVFGNHRSHGHYLAKGGSMNTMVAEIYGKATGCSGGRGGSMHLIAPEHGVLGIVPIVSGTISLALGSALASSIRKDGGVTVSFFGDGATGEGVLYESLNFAALKKLPIIFCCENNLYSTHLPISEIRTNPDIHKVAAPFGVKAYRLDGNEVIGVYESAMEAVEWCRSGKGPVFMEFLTYRFRGHVGPDDNVQGSHTDIRPKSEIDAWLKRDPLLLLEQKLMADGLMTTAEKDQILQAVNKEVDEAHAFTSASDKPKPEELCHYVFK